MEADEGDFSFDAGEGNIYFCAPGDGAEEIDSVRRECMEADLPAWLTNHRLTAIVGHMGSGKTELAVNAAVTLAKAGIHTALADLDIVNPYFRSREQRDLFCSLGIRFVASSQTMVDADLPSLPAELNALIQDGSLRSILDIGGDSGARVLGRYRHQIAGQSHQVWFVLNARRPQTNTVEKALLSLRQIEQCMGLPAAGIVNNTHLCTETTPRDVALGAELAHDLAEKANIPVLCHTVPRTLAEQVPELTEPVFPLDIYMKKPWER